MHKHCMYIYLIFEYCFTYIKYFIKYIAYISAQEFHASYNIHVIDIYLSIYSIFPYK